MLRHALRMANQSAAAANFGPFVRIIPAPQPPPDASDPATAMRQELMLLRIELELLRENENEMRQIRDCLLARIDCLMENRDRWQREAERLSTLAPAARVKRRHPPSVPLG